MDIQVLTVSSKGQISLPVSFRKGMSINTGDLLAAYAINDMILLKPINVPSEDDFKMALDAAQLFAKNEGLTEADVDKAIKKYRKEKK